MENQSAGLGKAHAPSAGNRQEIEIYVAADGPCPYDAKAHPLQPVLSDDIRDLTGSQPFVREAAANTAFIGQNVYLFCTSEGLATVFRGMVGRDALAKTMKLRPD